jgi:predicted MPP superfamily phosphohydrolase
MKTLRIDLPANLKEIELYALSDWHIGDKHHDAFHTEAILKHILETPNAYCILNGDLMDTAIANSVGDTYGAKLQPMEQLKLCVKLFQGLADAGKILCILPGNHENRVFRYDGIDITAMMAAQLGLSHRYSETAALLFIRFGSNEEKKHHGRKIVYTVYASHGSGGGKRVGGKINRLEDMANIVDADIYIMGHTHQPAIIRNAYYRVSAANSSVQCIDRLFVNTAAALDYGGYGEAQGFRPASKESPVIILSGRLKNARAKV